MTELAGSAAGSSAGAMLRAARERQGLHVAALAASIKIPQRKLEALEADRYDELPDATFTRALAMTVCRALKLDPAPVLAQLPQGSTKGLATVGGGLNTPFRDRPGRADPAELSPARHPLTWGALVVLLAAAAVFLLPAGWWQNLLPVSAPAPVPSPAVPASAPQEPASAASAAELAASAAIATADAAVLPGPAASAALAPTIEVAHPASGAAAATDASAGLAVLRATDATWVEVVDAGGQVLVQRLLQPGESVGLNGTLPFRLKIGNAAATQLQFRGQEVDLASVTRDNVARLVLK